MFAHAMCDVCASQTRPRIGAGDRDDANADPDAARAASSLVRMAQDDLGRRGEVIPNYNQNII